MVALIQLHLRVTGSLRILYNLIEVDDAVEGAACRMNSLSATPKIFSLSGV